MDVFFVRIILTGCSAGGGRCWKFLTFCHLSLSLLGFVRMLWLCENKCSLQISSIFLGSLILCVCDTEVFALILNKSLYFTLLLVWVFNMVAVLQQKGLAWAVEIYSRRQFAWTFPISEWIEPLISPVFLGLRALRMTQQKNTLCHMHSYMVQVQFRCI